MSPFEYLSVLVSIIVGLGLSHLLWTAARLIQVRSMVAVYGPTLVWMGVLFVLQIQIWWAAFEWQGRADWSFGGFLLFLALPIGAYFLSVLLVPDLDEPEGIRLQDSYFANRRWFFGLLVALPLISLLHEAVQTGTVSGDADAAFRVAFAALAAVGLAVRSPRAHWVLTVTFALGFAAYVGGLFRQLP